MVADKNLRIVDAVKVVHGEKFKKIKLSYKPRFDTDFKFRDWQLEAFKLHKNKKYTITNVLMGGGKTIYSQGLGLNIIKKNPKARLVILTPQNNIALNFYEDIHINNEYWVTDKFLPSPDIKENIKEFVKFFTDSEEQIMVCTHATACQGFKQIKGFVDGNVHFFIDEAHHINTDDFDPNALGEFVKFAIESDAGVHLLTATPYRADKCQIIPNGYKDLFVTYFIPIDEYMKKYIHSYNTFNYSFAFIKNAEFGNYTEYLSKIINGEHKKTIVYLPHRGTPLSLKTNDGKYKEVVKIISNISGEKKLKIIEDSNGIITAGKLRFIDLVTQEGRDKKVSFISKNNKNLDVDYIICLGLCQEGFNWPALERSIIVGYKNSLTQLIQIMGRPLRELDNGFKNPEIIQVLSEPNLNEKSEEKLKKGLNDFLCYISCSLLVETLFDPPSMDGAKLSKDSQKIQAQSESSANYIYNFVHNNEDKLQEVVADLTKIKINSDSDETFKTSVRSYAQEKGFNDCYSELVAEQFLKIYKKRNEIFRKDKIKNISDKINVLDDDWICGFCDSKFGKIREVLSYGEKASLEEHIKFAINNGIESYSQWNKTKVPRNLYSDLFISKPEWLDLIWDNRRKKTSKKVIEKMAQLAKMNKTRTFIAKKFNLSITTVCDLLRGFYKKSDKYVIGKKFNNLTVINRFTKINKNKNKVQMVNCKCDCGKFKALQLNGLGIVKSCGCLQHIKPGKFFKFISPNGSIISGFNATQFGIKNKLNIGHISQIGHSKGYCLYHPKLVGTTHQERLDKGLYKKYIKLKK